MAKTKKKASTTAKPLVKMAKRAAIPAKAASKKAVTLPAKLTPKKVPAVRRQTNQLAEAAKKITITSEVQYQAASDLAGRIKAFIKARAASNKPMIDAAKLTLERIREEAATQIEGLDDALKHIGDEMTAFEDKREAEKAAQAAKIIADRVKQEKLERRALAADLIEEGNDEAARELLAAPSEVQEPVFQRLTAPGMSKRFIWTWELEDINKVNSEFLTTVDGAITAIVKGLGDGTEVDAKGHLAQLGDGIRVFKKPSRSFKAATEAQADSANDEELPPAGEALEVEPVGVEN